MKTSNCDGSSPDDSAKGGMSGSRPSEASVGRAHIIFSGSVQGVGFRYTAKDFASNLRLTGWVKNLPDRRVEMMCEGTREKVENLLYKLDKQFEGKIKHKDIDWMDARKSFAGFEITY